ncbi:MAG: hypothetical protein AAGC60_08325 [Acidobacteriota bacterium]
MRKIAHGFIGLTLLSTTILSAAEMYTATETFVGWPRERETRSRILVDEGRYRYEIEEVTGAVGAQHFDALLGSLDSDTPVALNREIGTFFWMPADPKPVSSLLSPLTRSYRLRDVEVESSTRAADDLDGRPTHEIEVRASFTVDSRFPTEIVRAEIEMLAVYRFVAGIDVLIPPPLQPSLRTGHEQIDEQLLPLLADQAGFPAHQRLEVRRDVVQGNSETTVLTRVLTLPEPTEAPADAFSVPKGFAEQMPEIGVPGMQGPQT